MFGIKRARATADAINGSKRFVDGSLQINPHASLLWQDEYFLGFVAGFQSNCILDFQLSSKDFEKAIVSSLAQVSNRNGDELFSRYVSAIEKEDENTCLGADNATLIYGVFMDRVNFESSGPFLSGINRKARGDKQMIIRMLSYEYLFQHIKNVG